MKNQIRTIFLQITLLAVLFGRAAVASADPLLTSWFTTYSGKYARLYTTTANQTAGTSVTTWSNGAGVQTNPAYCGVQEVDYSANWVYIRSSGLGSHVMGPWYLDANKTQLFPNYPMNSKTLYRFPRTPTIATNTLTSLGVIGYFVDGAALYDGRDSYFWNGTTETNQGTGYWDRDAYTNEFPSFDPNYSHQDQSATYHYHVDPLALRYLMGDNVLFNSSAKTYKENTTNSTPKHSPILGWAKDGYPIYGPYGYGTALNSNSVVRRMVSGYQLRNGQNGTDNLTSTRATIPAWAARAYGVSTNQTGPSITTTYFLGRYMQDYAYLGDCGKTQGVDFDLNEFNVRYCVTPEYPGGTWAYFECITTNGLPQFPYQVPRRFWGNPTGTNLTSITETVTTNYVGGPNVALELSKPTITGNTVTLSWSSVEGGTYQILSSTNTTTWSNKASNIVSQGTTTSLSTNRVSAAKCEFFTATRTAISNYDAVASTGYGITSVSPTSASRNTSFTLTINLSSSVNAPPQTAPINSVTIGTNTATSSTHVSATQVTANFTIPSGAAAGIQTVTVTFPGPPTNTAATVSYTYNNFTIN